MDRFAPALRRVARELDLPRNVRAAIVLEMAADLEAAYEHHRRSGAGEEEALRRAEELVLGSAEVVRRLGRLHRGSWREWSESIGARLSGGSDVIPLALGVIPILALAGVVAVRVFATRAGGFGWALLALGLAIAGVVAVEAGRLIAGGRGATRALSLLLVLSMVAPVVGLLAATLGLYSAAALLATGVPDATGQLVLATRMSQAGALLPVGLLLGIAGMLSWFVLLSHASVRATREVDALLGGETVTHENGGQDVLPFNKRRRG